MIKELFFTAALLAPSLAYAAIPSAVESGQIVSAGSVPILPPVPPGASRWILTFDDEFNGSSVNTSTWNVPSANAPYISVANSVLSLTDNPTTGQRSYMDTSPSFHQRFGYFVWRTKLPTNVSGEGDGLWPANWTVPISKPGYPGGCQEGNEEVDVMELFGMQRGITTQNTWTVHDWCVNQFSLTYPVSPGPNLAADFHQYGLLWVNDGSAHGTMSLWFDGVQQGSYTLDSRSMLWDDGIYLINQMVPCTTYKTPPCASSGNDPMQIDYVRAYQAQ